VLNRYPGYYLNVVILLFYSNLAQAIDHVPSTVIDEIRTEVALNSNQNEGFPLPLAAHWNSGVVPGSYSPDYQIKLIEAGHHILPWFKLEAPIFSPRDNGYYENAIKYFAKYNLPISFVSTQWERVLSDDPMFYELDEVNNPNVISLTGAIKNQVSPFSPISPWESAGGLWTDTALMKTLQRWYPDPPKIFFISNNEHRKLRWHEALLSKRYVANYGLNNGFEGMRLAVGDGWIPRYKALQEGMRNSLILDEWKKNSAFIGYNAFGGSEFGRWPGWIRYSLYTEGRMEPWPLAWDGASISFYVHNWNSGTDYNLMSPQIQAMNWLFMLEDAYKQNSNFWFEMSSWDGHEPSKENDKRKFYAGLGQNYTPSRYRGMVQFGMWLLRPRVVREFRGWTHTVADSGEYFDAVIDSVDSVYEDILLKRFWRRGELVANETAKHPFQSNIPDELKNRQRWYLLNADINPKRPWDIKHTELKLFSMALVLGTAPEREWLVYVFSPRTGQLATQIQLPGFGKLKLDDIPLWAFYCVSEATGHKKIIMSSREQRHPSASRSQGGC